MASTEAIDCATHAISHVLDDVMGSLYRKPTGVDMVHSLRLARRPSEGSLTMAVKAADSALSMPMGELLEALGAEGITQVDAFPGGVGPDKSPLEQILVYRQHSNGMCGHYALHNALSMLRAGTCGSDTKLAVKFAKDVLNGGCFWERFYISTAHLHIKAEDENGMWPWDKESLEEGQLERAYLRHLVRADHAFLHLGGRLAVGVFEYAYGQIRNSPAQIVELQSMIDEFRGSEQGTRAFIMGVTNHWVSLVAQKMGDKFHFVYMDSIQTPVLSLSSDADVQRIIDGFQAKRAERGKKPMDDRDVAEVRQALVDQRDAAVLLCRAMTGEVTLGEVAVTSFLDHLVESYERHVEPPMPGAATLSPPTPSFIAQTREMAGVLHAAAGTTPSTAPASWSSSAAAAGGGGGGAGAGAGAGAGGKEDDTDDADDAPMCPAVPPLEPIEPGSVEHLVRLHVWLESRHRPQSIRDSFFDFAYNFRLGDIPLERRKVFVDWANRLQRTLNMKGSDFRRTVGLFSNVLDAIKKVLLNPDKRWW